MQVVYKKTILDKIDEEIKKAEVNNRQIQMIILTREEFEEIDCRNTGLSYYNAHYHLPFWVVNAKECYDNSICTAIYKGIELVYEGKL